MKDQEYLTFETVDESNVATYACNASNEAGYVYKMFYLNILNQVSQSHDFDIELEIGTGAIKIVLIDLKLIIDRLQVMPGWTEAPRLIKPLRACR